MESPPKHLFRIYFFWMSCCLPSFLFAQNHPCTAVNLPNNMTYFDSYSTVGLSNSGVPSPSCGVPSADIWFEVAVPASGDIDIATLAGTLTDGAMAVYEGSCANLTEVACTNDDNCGNTDMPILQFDELTPGATYFIRFWAETGSLFGDFEIRITDGDPEPVPLTLDPIGTAFFTNDGCVQLTTEGTGQVGCAWRSDLVDFSQPFSNIVNLNFGDITTNGADGITMTYHNNPNGSNTCGPGGGSIGAQGLQNTFIIEFDTWDNGPGLGDIPDDHVSIDINGNYGSPIEGPISLGEIEDGLDHEVQFHWEPATMTYEVYFDGNLVISGVYDIIANAFNGENMVYCGFTGSTGGAINNQIVCPVEPEIFPAGSESTVDVEICEGECYFAGGDCQVFPGVYTDIYNSFNGCDSIIHTNLKVLPFSTTSVTDTICDGGCVTIGSEIFCVSGNYQVILSNYLDCDSIVNLDLEIMNVEASISGNDVIDCNEPVATLDGSASFPAGIDYNWTTGDGNILGSTVSPVITVDAGGTYHLEISFTQNGVECTDVASFTVTEFLTVPIIEIEDPNDLNCETASLNLDASGSADGNDFNWTGPSVVWGQGTSVIGLDEPGVYTLILTNNQSGCSAQDSVSVAQDTIAPNIQIANPELLTCAISEIVLDATNSDDGVDFEINWTGGDIVSGENTLMPTVEETGIYNLTITNLINGCSANQNVMVEEDITPPILTLSDPDLLNCENAQVVLEGITNITNSNILWTTQTGNLSGNDDELNTFADSPGEYILTVTDLNNGCETTDSVTVEENLEVPVSDAGEDAILNCDVDFIELDGLGSSSGNQFVHFWLFENGDTLAMNTLTPTVDMAGTYTISVVHNLSACVSVDTVVIEEDNNVPNIEISSPDLLTCAIQNITIDGSGSDDDSGIFVEWQTSDGNILSGINELMPVIDQPGIYTLTLFNSENGCSSVESVTVLEDLTEPVPQINFPDTLTCSNESIFLDASPSGNESDFQIQWQTPDGNILSGNQSLNPEINAPGIYNLNLTNIGNGCSQNTEIEVLQNIENPNADAGLGGLLTCEITTLEMAGTSFTNAPLGYFWNTLDGEILSGEDTVNPTIGSTGTYVLTVTNLQNGCTETDEVQVTEDISVPEIEIAAPDLLSCADTIIEINATGSANAANFQIEWTTLDGNILSGENTLNPLVDADGNYILNITNAENGCSNEDSIMVEESISILMIETETPELLTCLTLEINLEAQATGGANISYNWNTSDGNILTGQNSQTPVIDAPGVYSLLVIDENNGCTSESEIAVNQDVMLPIAHAGTNQTISCIAPETMLDGTLSSSGNNFEYLWTTADGNILDGENTLNPTVNVAADYFLIVTNTGNGCTAQSEITVDFTDELPQISISIPDTLTCNILSVPLSGTVTGDDLNLFSPTWSGSDILNGTNTLNPTVGTAGTYILTLENPQFPGCVVNEIIQVIANIEPPKPTVFPPDKLTCAVLTLDLDGTGSTSPENFDVLWSTDFGNILSGENTLTPTIDAPGIYTLILTNEKNGCSASQEVDIQQDTEVPHVEATVLEILTCDKPEIALDGSNSSIGTQFSYNWSTTNGDIVSGQNTLNPVVSQPGIYTLLITNNDNGCENFDETEVLQDIEPPIADAGITVEINCETNEASLNGSATSSSSNLEFLWSSNDGMVVSGQNSETPLVNGLGTYILTITNLDNGCTDESSVQVIENLPIAETEPIDPFCIDDFGEITVTSVSFGTPPYEYSFDGGMSFSDQNFIENIPSGSYSVIVKDAKGCEYSETVFISEGLNPILIMETEAETALGYTYQINAQVNFPNHQIETLQWTPSTGLSCDDCLNPEVTPLNDISYQIYVQTEEGCETTGEIIIKVNKETNVYIPNAFSPNDDGINDVFMIYADDKNISTVKSFLIFNRWGETVFQYYDFPPNQPEFGWDGIFRGEKMNAGVFVWIAEVEFIDGQKEFFKGDLTLVR